MKKHIKKVAQLYQFIIMRIEILYLHNCQIYNGSLNILLFAISLFFKIIIISNSIYKILYKHIFN